MTDAPASVLEFDWPDRCIIGTIGRPGARAFYLQVRAGSQTVSLALEKQQADMLAQMMDEILDELRALDGNPHSVPERTPAELVDNDPLGPVQERFRVGALGLGWDPTTSQVVIEAHPLADEDLSEEEAGVLRVRMPVGAARAFALRTREVVDAGRLFCSDCGQPMDPEGHECTPPELP